MRRQRTVRRAADPLTEGEARRREAEALFEVGRALSQSLDPGVVGQRIVDSVRALLAAQSSILYRLEPETGDLAVVVCSGDAGSGFVPGVVLRAGTGIAGLAVKDRIPQVSRDVLRDSRLALPQELRARVEQAPFRAALAVPLIVAERVIGVLAAYDGKGRVFDARAIRLGQLFADQAALALENARLYEAARLRDRAIEAVAGGIVITDATRPDHPIVYANPGFERITGYRAADVIGRNPRFLQGPDTDPAAVAALRAALGEARPCSVDLLNYRKDGTPFWNALSVSPVLDAGGMVLQFVGIQSDITDRKRLEEQLRQSQKIEAVGRLAGGIAHDFNNLLTVITSRAEIALEAFGAADPGRANLEVIVKTADRGADLVRQLLAFSRRQVLQPKVLDLNAIVSNTSVMLRRLIGEHIDLALVLAPGLGRVKADPGQLEEVIVALAVNARDAMPEGGTLTITTSDVDLSVTLAVSDMGMGMDAETQAHIFEPFFTTKEIGRGTGLGLATVHGIVSQSGGHIDVSSEPGRGTTFRIRFPRVDDPAAVASAGSPGGGTKLRETILLAEDEADVRALAHEVLERAGYAVVLATDGTEALRTWEGYRGRIDLLLTDVVMPRMGGFELARRLRTVHPDLRVIFISGYANDLVTVDRELANAAAYLQKPFRPRTLIQKVREVLGA